MNNEQKDGIGWVWPEHIRREQGTLLSGLQQVEVAHGPELAALRLDRERLERWLEQNRRSNEIINEVFGEDKYAMPTTRDEFDAYILRIDAETEEEKK